MLIDRYLAPGRPGFRHYAAALFLGLISATGFAPLSLWPITLAAFALWIALVRRVELPSQALFLGWWFGVGHFTLGLNWIAHAFTFQDAMPHWFGYAAVVLLSFYLAVYPGIGCALAWRYGRSSKAVYALLFAVFWTTTEYLRATMFTGFAWNPIGAIWIAPLPLAAPARWIGTYGLGCLTVLTAASLYLLAQKADRRSGGALLGGVALFTAAAALLAPSSQPPHSNLAIRVVQPNIGQQDKYDPVKEEEHFRRLAHLSGKPTSTPRLIFWPEAAVPAFLDYEPWWRQRIAATLGPQDMLSLGASKVYYRKSDKGFYQNRELYAANNSLWVMDPAGRLLSRYDKAHLVPYGEYLPMRSLLQPLGLSRLVPGDVDFWPGPGPRTLTLPKGARPTAPVPPLAAPPGENARPRLLGPGRAALGMGVQICYEIIFSGEVIDPAHRPDFLFNPSNDAWFGSWGPPQHLAQARLRALEEGIPVIRSTPTGISALVDADGRLLNHISLGKAGAFDASLPRAHAPTLFAWAGNWAPLFFVLLVAASAVAIRRRTR